MNGGRDGSTGWWVLLSLAGAICVVVFFLPRGTALTTARVTTTPATAVHGELITPPPVNSNQLGQVMLAAEASHHKHTAIPSTQQRLVMYQLKLDQLTDEQPVNGAPAANVPTNLPGIGPATEPLLPGYAEVGFEKLAGFDLPLTDALVKGPPQDGTTPPVLPAQIPDDVRKLDGQRTGIRGFLLPIKMDDGLAVEFLLMRDRSFCCYGAPPRINQWITVRMKDRGVKPVMDTVITVYGTLHVGEMRENGYLVGIYALDADHVTGLPD
jgi:hypothetical protein